MGELRIKHYELNIPEGRMSIVVTGGAGFLGYHLAHGLSRRGESVHLLDIAESRPDDYNDSGPGKITWEQADVRDLPALDQALRGASVVIHAAAASPVAESSQIFSTNIQGTINVLRAARNRGVERVVYISSTDVYGIPNRAPIYEEDELKGVDAYSKSKIRAEEMCHLARNLGMIVPVIRPRAFLGEGRLGIFQILYDWVESGKRIPMLGNGGNYYQLLEVTDLVEAICLICTAPPTIANTTFNVGATSFSTVREDLAALCEYAGTGATVAATPATVVKPTLRVLNALSLSPLYKWVYATANKDSVASTAKIEETLGWEPRYSNTEALIRAYRWYIDNKASIEEGTGITHRAAWDHGILKLVKRVM